MVGGTSEASRFNIDTFSEILGLRYMEEVISKRDDFVAIFFFEPMQKFEYRGDMFSFGVPVMRDQVVFRNCRRDIFFFALSLGKVHYNTLM